MVLAQIGWGTITVELLLPHDKLIQHEVVLLSTEWSIQLDSTEACALTLSVEAKPHVVEVRPDF